MSAAGQPSPARRIGFILYDNRSGSTLLSAMLDRYPSIDVSAEVDHIAKVLEAPPAAGQPPSSGEASGAAPAATPRERSDSPAEQLRHAVDELCDPHPGITHQLVKGPRLHFHMASLAEAFPGCLFIEIVRDGRAVFASKRRTRSPAGGFMDTNLLHAAWNWRRKLQIAAASGQRVLTIRYEDLVRDPEATIHRLLDGLGVGTDRRRPERATIDFYREKIPDSHRYLHAKLRDPLSEQEIDAWRAELLPHEVLLYEMTNARPLTEHGYGLERLGRREPLSTRLRAYVLHLACMARWALGWISSGFRYALTPRILMQKVRNKYGEGKAPRPARSSGP